VLNFKVGKVLEQTLVVILLKQDLFGIHNSMVAEGLGDMLQKETTVAQAAEQDITAEAAALKDILAEAAVDHLIQVH
jgi:hypothetical protein